MGPKLVVRVLAAVIAASVLAVCLGGCAGGGGSASVSSPGSAPGSFGGKVAQPEIGAAPTESAGAPSADSASVPLQRTAASPLAERMVIRNGNVRLEVAKVQDAVGAIRVLTKHYGGVVAELQMASDTGDGGGTPQPLSDTNGALRSGLPFSASVTVLVPVAKFDAFRAEAAKLGTVLSENAADSDVTQQHVDLKARLDNSKAEEARLRTFFDSAKSVTDMLSIERELARVRGDIESMTAQLASLERQAAMATLTIELVEPKPLVRPSSGIDWGFGDALTTGVQAMAGLLKAALIVAIATAPVWILALALALLIRWRLRIRRIRRAQPPAETPADV
jgi:hypothetical protein